MLADLAMPRSLATLRRAVSGSSGDESLTQVDSCGRDGKKWTESSRQVLVTESLPCARDDILSHCQSQQLSEETEAQIGSGSHSRAGIPHPGRPAQL